MAEEGQTPAESVPVPAAEAATAPRKPEGGQGGQTGGGQSKRQGRPSKARGAPNSGDKGADKWTVRGVPVNVRRLATAEADRRGMTTGDWVAEAIVAQAKGRADATDLSADGKPGMPARSQPDDVAGALAALSSRLDAMETAKQLGLFGRLFGRRR